MSVRADDIRVLMRESASSIGRICLNLLFPRRCPICDGIVAGQGRLICPACETQVAFASESHCMKCGKPVGEREQFCKDCSQRSHDFDKGRAVFEYAGVAKSIYRFKYGGRREYADYYAEQIVKELGDLIRYWQPDAIIPVPIHWARRAARGYNQAELLAKGVGKRCNIPVYSKLVRRIKNTKPQKLLNVRERQNNLEKAFIISQNDVKLDTILLLDDIYTTGSTADAIASLLKQHGVRRVFVLSLAIGNT